MQIEHCSPGAGGQGEWVVGGQGGGGVKECVGARAQRAASCDDGDALGELSYDHTHKYTAHVEDAWAGTEKPVNVAAVQCTVGVPAASPPHASAPAHPTSRAHKQQAHCRHYNIPLPNPVENSLVPSIGSMKTVKSSYSSNAADSSSRRSLAVSMR